MREEVKKWFEKANRDINSAEYNFEGDRFEEACFFSQQAAEKALKAFDLYKSNKIIKTHDLLFLCKRVNAPEFVVKKCIKLNPVYTETRYPDFSDIETYTKNKTIEIISCSAEVLKWVKEKLSL